MPRRLSPCGDSRRQGCATGPLSLHGDTLAQGNRSVGSLDLCGISPPWKRHTGWNMCFPKSFPVCVMPFITEIE